MYMRAAAAAPAQVSAAPLNQLLTETRSVLPPEITRHLLRQAGVADADELLVAATAFAVQSFISDIVVDAMQHHRLRSAAEPQLPAPFVDALQPSAPPKEPNMMLTVEDLTASVRQRGISFFKPEYIVDIPFIAVPPAVEAEPLAVTALGAPAAAMAAPTSSVTTPLLTEKRRRARTEAAQAALAAEAAGDASFDPTYVPSSSRGAARQRDRKAEKARKRRKKAQQE